MKTHECESNCPRCGDELSLTTEWGWRDGDTCTAVLCCMSCRTESGWQETACQVCHASSEDEALAGISAEDFVGAMQFAMED